MPAKQRVSTWAGRLCSAMLGRLELAVCSWVYLCISHLCGWANLICSCYSRNFRLHPGSCAATSFLLWYMGEGRSGATILVQGTVAPSIPFARGAIQSHPYWEYAGVSSHLCYRRVHCFCIAFCIEASSRCHVSCTLQFALL